MRSRGLLVIAAGVGLLLIVTACSGDGGSDPTVTEAAPSAAPVTAATPAPTGSTVASTTSPPATPAPPASATTTTTTPTTTTTTLPPPTPVTTPGEYADPNLEIHLTFASEVGDVTSAELESIAMAILTDPAAWGRSGFTFVVDSASELGVVLAEPDRVDELCLPLTTRSFASCQNGHVVALNAERWRTATDDWDGTVDDYRRYLVNHEVGHLIGLRHPVERCPEGKPFSAVMEPQTAGLQCPGNGLPLDWEVEWAMNRPARVGPLPEWDGPRPEWP